MITKLGDTFTIIRNGVSIRQIEGSGGLPITRIETISNREVNRNRFGYAGIKDVDKYLKYILQDGDILMSHINSEKYLGKVALYTKQGEEKIIHGMNLLMLRANKSMLFPSFVKYFFETHAFLSQVQRITKKSVNQASFTVTALKEIEMRLPPLDEQRRIAAVLDKVSDLIAKRRQQLKKLDELVKARFVEMFGDPLGKSKYARERIAQLGGVGTGNTPSMRVAKYYASDDIPFVKPSDMLENGVTFIADGTAFIAEAARTVARIVPAASVLVTCIGTIGKVGITSCECACNQQINYVTPRDDVTVIYLAHCLSHCKQLLVEMSNAPVVPIINKSQFSTIEIPVPPLGQQKQFVSFAERVEDMKAPIRHSLEALTTLKQSLLQEYFG